MLLGEAHGVGCARASSVYLSHFALIWVVTEWAGGGRGWPGPRQPFLFGCIGVQPGPGPLTG